MKLPSYLTYDVRDRDGWPITLSPDDKIWLEDTLREAVESRGGLGLTLREARDILFVNEDPSRPFTLKIAQHSIWELAVTHHVLERLETTQIWILRELRKEYEEEG